VHEPAASYAQAVTEAQEILAFIGLEDKQHVEARSLPIMERKRLELGRALATRPRLLLLDEFMAGLTPVEIQATISLITELKERGITTVVVEHIIKAVMTLCSRIIVLNAGQKIAEGSPKEISTDPTVITAYLGKSYVGD
jgi:ABC-type branched-subunit amino acid transport system ATPase component